jgi:predicted GNAT superfamily acetyltransferase
VAEGEGRLGAFLVGFLSPSRPSEAYVHFVGVDPRLRGRGLARELYWRFFALARENGRSVVRAVTSPLNDVSVAFHRSLGFSAREVPDYDGAGSPKVLFEREL